MFIYVSHLRRQCSVGNSTVPQTIHRFLSIFVQNQKLKYKHTNIYYCYSFLINLPLSNYMECCLTPFWLIPSTGALNRE